MPATIASLGMFLNMQDLDGANLDDLSGNGNDGVLTGTTATAGQVCGARYFDGVDDLVTVTNSTTLHVNSAFTFGMWVKPDSVSGTKILAEKGIDGITNYEFKFYRSGTSIVFEISQAGGSAYMSAATAVFAAGTWIHLMGVFENTTPEIRIYRNGVLNRRNQTVLGGTPGVNSARALYIGNRNDLSLDFAGIIDEVRLYQTNLTGVQVSDIYNDTTCYPLPSTPMVRINAILHGGQRRVSKNRMGLKDFGLR